MHNIPIMIYCMRYNAPYIYLKIFIHFVIDSLPLISLLLMRFASGQRKRCDQIDRIWFIECGTGLVLPTYKSKHFMQIK